MRETNKKASVVFDRFSYIRDMWNVPLSTRLFLRTKWIIRNDDAKIHNLCFQMLENRSSNMLVKLPIMDRLFLDLLFSYFLGSFDKPKLLNYTDLESMNRSIQCLMPLGMTLEQCEWVWMMLLFFFVYSFDFWQENIILEATLPTQSAHDRTNAGAGLISGNWII